MLCPSILSSTKAVWGGICKNSGRTCQVKSPFNKCCPLSNQTLGKLSCSTMVNGSPCCLTLFTQTGFGGLGLLGNCTQSSLNNCHCCSKVAPLAVILSFNCVAHWHCACRSVCKGRKGHSNSGFSNNTQLIHGFSGGGTSAGVN